MIRAAVVGAAGYIGGELLRLLIGHPQVEVVHATSRTLRGRPVDGVHPNLRGRTRLTFSSEDQLGHCDVLFLATPHRETMQRMPEFLARANVVIDLSGDFRLQDTAAYLDYYGVEHEATELLSTFTPGIPELHRERLRTADRISVPGCMATAGILSLVPLAEAGLVRGDITVDARTGSSGSGAKAGSENLHAERSGALRVFAPTRHRHEAEIAQATGHVVRMTATGVEAVRGVQLLCRATLADGVDERAVRAAYRSRYAAEPFVRVVAARRGMHRFPDAKILSGSNFCDVGFALDRGASTVTVIAALDNLVKGGAGNAVQCMNVRLGEPEDRGLGFTGLHPN
ncbi:N-acetyl-gamma-glutamyl-phosphate/N-acetyl-gamma-aminoadipyl-phosphate reductase [Streptomyces spiroverticillatus]|uniref:N-acetyl-gamma-glutamyl-phosphate reductase n=1 Tax=Streptomyces finlayi TaxID=67296 RepID=A0A918X4E7_9ACTN|nr:N-acetyl-gamma-glutamyl-phosphate reductase [Streptomyces finlayi]GHA31851.1 N-acetyl-gamma-glutamyl-phosphate/N-acetyl-gamma-aminoadipyl-phosphate reductase [Streptomyces spiroverticillatus]GHD10864.1 N-acetyl-gamma-glutamyl-phosphate/N-acetyl-gamma-aminoadipyl-phosphate reductase [Streptomyces finlayi]